MASEKITAMIEELKTLTVLELSELVKAVEEEFGVSAAAAVSSWATPPKIIPVDSTTVATAAVTHCLPLLYSLKCFFISITIPFIV